MISNFKAGLRGQVSEAYLEPVLASGNISTISEIDPIYRKFVNSTPVTVTLAMTGNLTAKEFYLEQSNWGRVTLALPSGYEWQLPDRALPIMGGKGSIINVVPASSARWRIDEVTPNALLKTDTYGYHPVQESGLKYFVEVPYGMAQTRIGQSDQTPITFAPCKFGCSGYLTHIGTDPGSTAHHMISDSSFPGGYSLLQRTAGGTTYQLSGSYTPTGHQYTVAAVFRSNALGTNGTIFRTNSGDSQGANYVNALYGIQPLPITSYTVGDTKVDGEINGIGTVTTVNGTGTFTAAQDETFALQDFLVINNTHYRITTRNSATEWVVSPANTISTISSFVHKPMLERITPKIFIWSCGQETGTATAGGASTLTNSSKTWPTNCWAYSNIVITAGTGAGQTRNIASNTNTVITVTSAWAANPDNTSVYRIEAVETFLSNKAGVKPMMLPSSVSGMSVPTELTYYGSWAVNMYAIAAFDGVLSNRPALLRWLGNQYPFTLV